METAVARVIRARHRMYRLRQDKGIGMDAPHFLRRAQSDSARRSYVNTRRRPIC